MIRATKKAVTEASLCNYFAAEIFKKKKMKTMKGTLNLGTISGCLT